MNQYRKPDFFIVGAPKCGTTSLYYYLRQHPEIFLPDYKEPHYFGKDLKKRSDEFIDNDLLDFFEDDSSSTNSIFKKKTLHKVSLLLAM